mgnify:FL=1
MERDPSIRRSAWQSMIEGKLDRMEQRVTSLESQGADMRADVAMLSATVTAINSSIHEFGTNVRTLLDQQMNLARATGEVKGWTIAAGLFVGVLSSAAIGLMLFVLGHLPADAFR